MKRRNKQSGFTLVELVIVVIILMCIACVLGIGITVAYRASHIQPPAVHVQIDPAPRTMEQ